MAKTDMSRFWVVAWCMDPDLILIEKIIIVPEADQLHDPCGQLCLKLEEIIHS